MEVELETSVTSVTSVTSERELEYFVDVVRMVGLAMRPMRGGQLPGAQASHEANDISAAFG